MSETSCFEFECAECGRDIVQIIAPKVRLALCAQCVALPGWYENENLCRVLDPDLWRQTKWPKQPLPWWRRALNFVLEKWRGRNAVG